MKVKKYTDSTYTKLQKLLVAELKLKVGDKVKITREAQHLDGTEFGWDDWCVSMKQYVGDTATVDCITSDGIHLDNGWLWPITVLELVPDANIRISDEYSAEICDNGDVQVGCTRVKYEVLSQIFDAAYNKRMLFDAKPKKKVVKKVAKKRITHRRAPANDYL